MKIMLLKAGEGMRPFRPEDAAALRALPGDELFYMTARPIRNGRFFRKWFALVKFAYDVWTEHAPPLTMLGHRVQPNFDVFRKNLTVLAGFYEPVYQLDGTMRLEAKSIAWNRMDEAEFSQLYDKTIDAIIDNVAGMQGMTVAKVKEVVDETLRFA